jgi:hypothetical protein
MSVFMRPEVFRVVSLVTSFILAGSTLGFARAIDGERTNFAADFFEHLDVVKDGISFGFGEHALSRSIETQTMLIRHTATKLQRQVAEQNARTYVATLSPEKKQQLKRKKVRYLAVPTVPSKETSPKAKEVLMIWDVPRETLASKTVYELGTTPEVGKLASYDNMVAEYVGQRGKKF